MPINMNNKNADLLLINPPYHRRNGSGVIFPLGLGYISSTVTNAGFEVEILDSAAHFQALDLISLSFFRKWLTKKLMRYRPNLAIGVGPCTTSSVRSLHVISDVCKEIYPDLPVVYGGPLASLPGNEVIFFQELSATAVVSGDGENIMCDIMYCLSNQQSLDTIIGLSTYTSRSAKSNIIDDLDSLLFPFRPDLNTSKYQLSVRRQIKLGSFATVLASRGCPYHCSYCTSGLLRNGQYNRRSLINIIDEIQFLINSSNVKSIVFYDDAFFPSPDKLHRDVEAFARAMAALQKPIVWQIEIRPNVLLAMDSELAILLFKAGCRQINIGIEKSEYSANLSLGKNTDPDQLKNICQKIVSATPKMRLTGTFIIGGKGESFSTIQHMEEYANSLGLLFAHFYPLELYPGTELYKKLYPNKDELWWYRQIMSSELPWGEILYEDHTQNRQILLSWANHAYESFYRNPEWQSRAYRYLGNRYATVLRHVTEWQTDRFCLQQG